METSPITYLTKENAEFYETSGGFLAMKAFLPPKSEYDLEETEEAAPSWQDFGRVFLHRAFPYNDPDRYISVLDEDGYEYGIIEVLSRFDEKTISMLNKALNRKYFIPQITKIISIKEQFGFSFWKVMTDKGECEFSVKDTFKSIIRVSEIKIVILDSDGGRFCIEDINALSPSDYKKIELYL